MITSHFYVYVIIIHAILNNTCVLIFHALTKLCVSARQFACAANTLLITWSVQLPKPYKPFENYWSNLHFKYRELPVRPLFSLMASQRWALQWRQNEPDGASNHQPHDCLFHRLFRRRSKKISKLRVTGLCEGKSSVTAEFPARRASNAENVSIWWRHHGLVTCNGVSWTYTATCLDSIFLWWNIVDRPCTENIALLWTLFASTRPCNRIQAIIP